MKKILSMTLILAILLTTAVVGAVSASADSFDTSVVIGSETYVANIGDTFTYTVSLQSSKKLSAGQIELPVDFAILSGETESDLTKNIKTVSPVAADTALIKRFTTASKSGLKGYVLNFATDGSYDFTTAKTVLKLQFKVLKAGTVNLNPALREFIDASDATLIDVNGKVVSNVVKTTVTVSLGKKPVYTVKTPLIKQFNNTADGISFSWDAAAGASKYRVYRKDNGKWTSLGLVTATTYLDKNVASGTSYSYTLRCTAADGTTFVSDYVNDGWSWTYVAEPVISAFDSGDDGLRLSWEAVKGASWYRVYRKNGTQWKSIGDTAETYYLDTDVTAGTQYTYAVACLDSGKNIVSSYSSTGFTSYYLGAPVLKSVAVHNKYITLTWDAMPGAENYAVFRKTADTGWFKIGDTVETTFNDRIVDSGVTYTYTVRCVSADGQNAASSYDPEGLTKLYLDAPVIKSISNTLTGAKITWGKVNGAEKYRVFRKAATGGWKKVGDTAGVSFVDKKAVSGTAYSYTVRCINAAATAFTSDFLTTGTKNTFLSAPVIKSVANNVGNVTVKWAKVKGAVKYRVFRKVGRGGWKKLADTTGVTWKDTKVVSGKIYRYTVRCIDKTGKTFTSAYNTTGKAITYIAAPTVKSVAKVKTGIQITWNKPAGAVKYRIFRKVRNGSWKKLADTTSLKYIDKKVKKGYKYAYTVRCISKNGKTYTSNFTTGKAINYK